MNDYIIQRLIISSIKVQSDIYQRSTVSVGEMLIEEFMESLAVTQGRWPQRWVSAAG